MGGWMSPIGPEGVYAIAIILPILSSLTVVARFYVRQTKKAGLGTDDWTALGALATLWAIAGLILTGAARGFFGTHSQQDPITGKLKVTKENINVQYQWIVLLLTIFAITLIKLSAVFLYRRLFQVSRPFNIYSIVLLVILTLWAIAFLFANIFQCGLKPWAFWSGPKFFVLYCSDTAALTVAFCATDLFLDLVVLLSPVPVIWKLHISTTRKLGVLGIFALGLLSTAASAARLYIMYSDNYRSTMGARDVIGQNSQVVTWSIVEVGIALISCCLPTLRSLFTGDKRSLSNIFRSFRSRATLGSNSGSSSHKQSTESEGRALASIGGTNWRSEKSGAEMREHSAPSSRYGKEGGSMV